MKASAHSPALVQMLEVAFSRRICCSRVRERQHEAALAVGVDGLADQPARHLAHILVAGGEQADIGAAEAQPVADRLALADHDVGAHLARRLDEAERHDLGHHHDQQRAGGMAGLGEPGEVAHMAEEARILHDDAGRLLVDLRDQIFQAFADRRVPRRR